MESSPLLFLRYFPGCAQVLLRYIRAQGPAPQVFSSVSRCFMENCTDEPFAFCLSSPEVILDKWLSADWLTMTPSEKTVFLQGFLPSSSRKLRSSSKFFWYCSCFGHHCLLGFPHSFPLCRNGAELCGRHHLWSKGTMCHAISGARQAVHHDFSHHPMPGTWHHLHVSSTHLSVSLPESLSLGWLPIINQVTSVTS